MPDPHTAEQSASRKFAEPNAETRCEVTRADLPLYCPTGGTSLWNSHPRVYLSIEDSGECRCPYCGTLYVLKD